MKSESGSRKSRQRERLVLALLEQPALQKAAASIGMSATTAWRISKTTAFAEEYRTARRDAYWRAIARLQHASGAATSLILSLMTNREQIQPLHLRAAVTVLEQSLKGMQVEELEARIARIEATIKR